MSAAPRIDVATAEVLYSAEAQGDKGRLTTAEQAFVSQFADPSSIHNLVRMLADFGMPLQKQVRVEVQYESGRKAAIVFRKLT